MDLYPGCDPVYEEVPVPAEDLLFLEMAPELPVLQLADCMEGLKDFALAVVVLAALVFLFSTQPAMVVPPWWGCFGDDYPGDRGMILPGDGNEMPEAVMQMDEQTASDQMKENQMRTGKDPGTAGPYPVGKENIYKVYKEGNSVGEMVLVFWHGVAAVLIGETAALMVAAAWLKIKG